MENLNCLSLPKRKNNNNKIRYTIRDAVKVLVSCSVVPNSL